MTKRPSTPAGQTQPQDHDPRTPPPAPVRGPGRSKQPRIPGHGYRMSGNQVPGASTNVNADASFGMNTPTRIGNAGRPAPLHVPAYGYRMSGDQLSDAASNLNADISFGMSTFTPRRDMTNRPTPLQHTGQGNQSSFIPTPTVPNEDADFYNDLMAVFDDAGYGASQPTSTEPRTPTNPNAGGSPGMNYTATRHNTDHGTQMSPMQWPHTPNNPNDGRGFDRSMLNPPRRHPAQPPAHLRNMGHANRVSLMPPIPPTPTNPNAAGNLNVGASLGNPDDGAVFDSPNVGPSFGMGLSTRPASQKMPLNHILKRLSRSVIPSVTGAINSRVNKSPALAVQPLAVQQKKKRTIGKMGDLSIAMNNSGIKQLKKGSFFRFLDLPPEIRNDIYEWATVGTKQALVVHRPRLASLRSSTRADRSRALPDHDPEDDNKPKGKKAPLERKTSRPFFPFTQVCQQIRSEFYPIYLGSQEIGLDLNDVIPYLLTVYNKETLSEEQLKMKDRPFKGNLTIAINGRVLSIEKDGVQIIELLILWANSVKMEAGFGRYSVIGYNPHTDGEAKDMYRLFGRCVLSDRTCSNMNKLWRKYLRGSELASVTIHRAPPPVMVQSLQSSVFTAAPGAPQATTGPAIPMSQRPYFHILFKPSFAEPWMRSVDSPIPAGWLAARGFANMEFFQVKVGRWEPGHYNPSSQLV